MPCCNTAAYKRLQRLLFRPCSYTAHAAKQRTGLYSGVSCNLPHSTAADTRPIQAAIISPAPRWSVCQRPDALHRYQIPAPRRTLYSSAQPPYYNKVYKGAWGALCYGPMPDSAADCRLCKPGGWRSGTGQSGTLHPAGQSSGQGAAGGAEPLATLAAALFGLSPDS